jgi:hypothetical protein
MSIPAGPTSDAFPALIDPSNLDPPNPSKSSGIQTSFHCAWPRRFRLWHAERWPSRWWLPFRFWGSRPTKSPAPVFLTQTNRIRPGNRVFRSSRYGLYLFYYQCVRLLGRRAAILELGKAACPLPLDNRPCLWWSHQYARPRAETLPLAYPAKQRAFPTGSETMNEDWPHGSFFSR